MAKLNKQKWITKGYNFIEDSDGDLCIIKNRRMIKLPDGSLTKYLRNELRMKGLIQ